MVNGFQALFTECLHCESMPGGFSHAAARPAGDRMVDTCLADHEEHLIQYRQPVQSRLMFSHYMSKSYAFVKKALPLRRFGECLATARPGPPVKGDPISLESDVFMLFSAHILLHNQEE
jgi:hypothetical protein